jgi:hypothetical protein
MAASVENTQADLKPLETTGRHRNGNLFDAEIGVSKVRLDSREFFVVCMRETTARKASEAAIRESEARNLTLVENAPEAIVVLDMDAGRFVECNENAVRFFKMTRDELLAMGPEQISPPLQQDGSPSFGIARGHIDRALAGEAPCFSGCTATLGHIPASPPRAPAFLRQASHSRQHHRHHRTQAQRTADSRRSARLRKNHE